MIPAFSVSGIVSKVFSSGLGAVVVFEAYQSMSEIHNSLVLKQLQMLSHRARVFSGLCLSLPTNEQL
jgi:hypothetical protein